jgi:hypothetical protein
MAALRVVADERRGLADDRVGQEPSLGVPPL